MINQKLQQKLLQKLSPQQIQLIKLLEVPTMQLEQRIKKEIEENPVLEEGEQEEEGPDDDLNIEEQENEELDTDKNDNGDEFTFEDYIGDDDEIPDYRLNSNNYSKDDKKSEMPYSSSSSFHEHLLSQLGLRVLSEKQQTIAEYVIGNIDDDGYLRRDIEAIINDLAFLLNINTSEDEVLEILGIIQDFEPAGIAARDLQESLLIQINKKLNTEPHNQEVLKTASSILSHHFNEFSKKHYDKIIQKLSISEATLKKSVDEILRLNPKPGGSFSSAMSKSAHHITPDFILEEVDGVLVLNLNSRNVPDLRINRTYANMIENYSSKKKKPTKVEKDAITFVKQKLDSAKWFIDAIRQRQNTLMMSMNAIIEYQREYFLSGDETKLRPMILKDIAEKTNLDISTISRVANSKYIQTPFGIFPLKYFFSEGMQTESGEEVSTREIKKILQDCIEGESKKKPLTDDKLAKILQQKGYQIARRTVAKYREQMNILVARLRKEL